jgi:hypothetical protein
MIQKILGTQYYEELLPASKSDDTGKDISSLIANEIADLKNPRKQVFTIHETGIASLVYLEMARNAPGTTRPCPVTLQCQ